MELFDKRNNGEIMERLGLEETLVKVVKMSVLRCMGHVLRKER